MFREALAEDAGMLLLWPVPQEAAIWMENTYLPLDLFFIREGGVIAKVHEGARPHDRTVIASDGPVLMVLELPAGTAARLGLAEGDLFRLETAP